MNVLSSESSFSKTFFELSEEPFDTSLKSSATNFMNFYSILEKAVNGAKCQYRKEIREKIRKPIPGMKKIEELKTLYAKTFLLPKK